MLGSKGGNECYGSAWLDRGEIHRLTPLAQGRIDSQCQYDKRVLPPNEVGQTLHDTAQIFSVKTIASTLSGTLIASKMWANNTGGALFPGPYSQAHRGQEITHFARQVPGKLLSDASGLMLPKSNCV